MFCRRNPSGDRFGGRLDVRNARVLTAAGHRLRIRDLFESSKWLTLHPVIYHGLPRLELEPHLFLDRRTKGRKPLEIKSIGLLTATTKMRCWSFSLPAGPPALGGCCISSTLPAKPGRHPICAGCYATSGMYGMYDSIGVQQQIRKEWTRRMVVSGRFVEAMANALSVSFDHPKVRETLRRGVEPDDAIAQIDPRYFRLHDSGDLGWLPGYAEGWAKVAAKFPRKIFWAPTRDLWTRNARLEESLVKLAKVIVLRPSAYHFWDEPPEFGGAFAAGTTVAVRDGIWNCPAVLAGIRKQHGKTCSTSRCRRCWNHPEVQVAYAPHGTGVEECPGCGPKVSKRKNPGPPPLEDVISAYEGARQNPWAEDGIGGFLNDSDINPSDYPEEQWEHVFDSRRVPVEDRIDTLEQLAEWDT